jgi:hypothetical protein
VSDDHHASAFWATCDGFPVVIFTVTLFPSDVFQLEPTSTTDGFSIRDTL